MLMLLWEYIEVCCVGILAGLKVMLRLQTKLLKL